MVEILDTSDLCFISADTDSVTNASTGDEWMEDSDEVIDGTMSTSIDSVTAMSENSYHKIHFET